LEAAHGCTRSRTFIGSSSEGLEIARALQAEVDQYCEPTIWSQNVFAPSGTTLGDLILASQNFDFAALILTPDDSVVSRGEQAMAARDNVIFELGLFLGALGSQRVFIIHPIERSAVSQGWKIRTRSSTAFRLIANNGNRYTFTLGSPPETRDRLRLFAQQLQSAGLRISQPVLRPVNEPESSLELC
jgi:Predicted nucleotide-binding protein containing TIR-like domain